MVAVVQEKFNSRVLERGSRPQSTRLYSVTQEADEIVAITALQVFVPTSVDGLPLQVLKVSPIGDPIESEAWDAEAQYSLDPIVQGEIATVGSPAIALDTTGGTQHLTQALETISGTAPGLGTAADYKGAIGVNADRVDGVDVAASVYNFTETHVQTDAFMSTAYKRILADLTARFNDAAFKGFNTGEVLFMGATASRRAGGSQWDVTYRFAFSENRTDVVVGDITVPAKNGWEYLWVRYGETEDQAVLVQRPLSAYVERVFEPGDFATLGIGT